MTQHAKKETARHSAHPGKKTPARDVAKEFRHWILVADHKNAHLYRKSPKGIERIPEEHLHCCLPVPREESSYGTFLHDLARWLDAARKKDAFDRIALIGPPEALEALHTMVGKEARCCICAALERDIEEITEDEIEDHLTEVMWL